MSEKTAAVKEKSAKLAAAKKGMVNLNDVAAKSASLAEESAKAEGKEFTPEDRNREARRSIQAMYYGNIKDRDE